MLKNLNNNKNIIQNIRDLKNVEDINFVFEYGGNLFSSNLKDTVSKIINQIGEDNNEEK